MKTGVYGGLADCLGGRRLSMPVGHGLAFLAQGHQIDWIHICHLDLYIYIYLKTLYIYIKRRRITQKASPIVLDSNLICFQLLIMAGASATMTLDLDDSDSDWSMLDPSPPRKRKTLTEQMRIKEEEKRLCKKAKTHPLMQRPCSTWKSTPASSRYFHQELESARYTYDEYRKNCITRGLKPVRMNQFCLDILCQSGWFVKKDRFMLSTEQ